MIRFQKHCGQMLFYTKYIFTFILEEYSALSKQTYTATVAKIITLLTLIQIKHSAVYAAFMHVLRLSDF